MKKVLTAMLAVLLCLGLAACGGNGNEQPTATGTGTPAAELKTIKIGVSPKPHAEIVEQVVEDLKAEGINLEILEFDDYIIPNTALDDGSLDMNFFQHQPYLDSFNEENGTKLVSIADIHYEPMAIYAGKTATLEDLQDGATVAVPDDTTNEARALQLLEKAGLIKLKEGVGLEATVQDIEENSKNLKITELEAAQIPKSLQDVDVAVINGNYALDAGLKANDALLAETSDSEGAQSFINILVVKEGNENDPDLIKVANAIKSAKVKTFIEETYDGAVVPVF